MRYEPDIEQCFLGCLLIPGDYLPKLSIQLHHFSILNNGRIFKAFMEQKEQGKKPDILTLSTDKELIKHVDISYIAELNNKVPSNANILFYEQEIINAWKQRALKNANERFIKKLDSETFTGEIDLVIQEQIKLLSGTLYDNEKKDSLITFDDYIDYRANNEYWKEYSPRLFGGNLPFPDGTISAIGGAPGGGKSAALVNLCRELLTTAPINNPHPGEREMKKDINAKRKIIFISAEMSTVDLTDRLALALAWQTAGEGEPHHLETVKDTNQDYRKLLRKAYGTPPDHWTFTPEEESRVGLFRQVNENYIRPSWNDRLKIFYVRGLKSFDNVSNIILNNAEPGTLVLMDYLQLMPICNTDIGQGNPRYLEIRHIMDMAILAAERTQSIIIAAAQLGREDRKGGSKGDDTQGWRESGDIEQTAWNLIKLTREKINDTDKLSFRITKARSSAGVNTAYDLEWIPGYQYMTYDKKDKAQGNPKKNPGQAKSKTEPDRRNPHGVKNP